MRSPVTSLIDLSFSVARTLRVTCCPVLSSHSESVLGDQSRPTEGTISDSLTMRSFFRVTVFVDRHRTPATLRPQNTSSACACLALCRRRLRGRYRCHGPAGCERTVQHLHLLLPPLPRWQPRGALRALPWCDSAPSSRALSLSPRSLHHTSAYWTVCGHWLCVQYELMQRCDCRPPTRSTCVCLGLGLPETEGVTGDAACTTSAARCPDSVSRGETMATTRRTAGQLRRTGERGALGPDAQHRCIASCLFHRG